MSIGFAYVWFYKGCIYHVKFTSYCELIECSRPIRFFIVSLMYNNYFKGGMEKLSGCLQTCNAVVPAKFIFRLVLGQACKYPTSMRFTDRVLNLFLATAKWLNQGSQICQIWRIYFYAKIVQMTPLRLRRESL